MESYPQNFNYKDLVNIARSKSKEQQKELMETCRKHFYEALMKEINSNKKEYVNFCMKLNEEMGPESKETFLKEIYERFPMVKCGLRDYIQKYTDIKDKGLEVIALAHTIYIKFDL